MPILAEMRVIDGELWVRVPYDEYKNGFSIWTPEEAQQKYEEGYKSGYDACADAEQYGQR